MRIDDIQIELRNRSLEEIFDLAFLLLKTNIVKYIKLLGVPLLFFISINIAIPLYIEYSEGVIGFHFSSQFLMLFVLFLEKSIMSLFLVIYNGHFLFNHTPSKRFIWVETIKSFPRYLWHQIIARGFYLFILTFSLLLPWRSTITHFFKSEVLLLEKLKGKKINTRLSVLSKGHIDRILLFITLDIIFCMVYMCVMILTYKQLLSLFHLNGLYWWLDANISILFLSPPICMVLIPYMIFHSTAKFLFYIDSRSRKEGWGVELQFKYGLQKTRGIDDDI